MIRLPSALTPGPFVKSVGLAAPLALVALIVLMSASGLFAVSAQAEFLEAQGKDQSANRTDVSIPTPDYGEQLDQLRRAGVRLPIAAGLAVILAMRPRRKGTPHRRAPVIQTQVILAIIGAVVMLVVGSSLARAFGIVGAAGLVRYRAKIEDPKDAGVMLSTLAVGLASGVGLWMLAVFSTGFILLVLGVIESFEPKTTRPFTLEIKVKDPAALKPKIDQLLTRTMFEHELMTTKEDEISYDVQVALDRKTDRLSEQILQLDPNNVTAVEWKEKKEKK
jgi:uncharacterized membrane protein YhiD involved in acid resistance